MLRKTSCYRFMVDSPLLNRKSIARLFSSARFDQNLAPRVPKAEAYRARRLHAIDMADAMDVKAGLEALIQAAQFLEENGASTTGAEVDIHTSDSRKRLARHRIKKPSPYSRTTHNLLEKNRRAQLRDCLEVLRQHVPFPDKLTTLALLQSARKYIEALKQKEREESQLLSELQRTQTILLTRLAELGAGSQLLPALNALTAAQASTTNGTTMPPATVEAQSPEGTVPMDTPITKPALTNGEEEENAVIDVIHDSEDDTSSTTSGSDGGCTSTSHKNISNYDYHS